MKGDSVFSPSEPARGRAVGNPSGFVAGGHLSSLDKRASLASLSPTKLLRKKTSAEPPADEDLSDWEDLVPGNLVIDLDGSGNSPTTTAVANGDCQSAERKRKLAKMPDRPSGSVEESPSGRTDKVNGAKRDKSGSKLNWKPKENHSDLTSEPLPKMKIKRNKMPTRQSGAKHEVISVVEESSSNALSGGTQDSTLSTDTSNSTLEMPKIQEGMVESCSTASSASTSTITTTSQPSSSSAGETLIENGHKDESPLVGKSHKSKMGKGRRDNTTIDAIEEPLQKRPKLSPSQVFRR